MYTIVSHWFLAVCSLGSGSGFEEMLEEVVDDTDVELVLPHTLAHSVSKLKAVALRGIEL